MCASITRLPMGGISWNLVFYTFRISGKKIISVIKSRRMRWVGNIYIWRRRQAHAGFWLGSLRESDHLEDPGVDGRKILRWIFRKWNGGMDWIDLVQVRDRWRTLVNAIMNLWLPENVGNFLTSWEPVSFSRITLLHGVSK